MATAEINRLARLRVRGRSVGSVHLVNTETVLKRAASKQYIRDMAETRDVYKRLRDLDDGLPPIETTGLLSSDLWP